MTDGDGKPEAPAAGTSRVDEQDARALAHARLVRVTGDDDLTGAGIRLKGEILQVMKHQDADTAQLERKPRRQLARPGASIVVPAHGVHGRQRT